MLLDALFVNGRFRTLDPERPLARSLGVLSGLIVGLDEELDGCRAAVVHDLGGAPAVPGLHDAHYHLSLRGQQLRNCDVAPALADGAGGVDALCAALSRHAATLPADAWV